MNGQETPPTASLFSETPPRICGGEVHGTESASNPPAPHRHPRSIPSSPTVHWVGELVRSFRVGEAAGRRALTAQRQAACSAAREWLLSQCPAGWTLAERHLNHSRYGLQAERMSGQVRDRHRLQRRSHRSQRQSNEQAQGRGHAVRSQGHADRAALLQRCTAYGLQLLC